GEHGLHLHGRNRLDRRAIQPDDGVANGCHEEQGHAGGSEQSMSRGIRQPIPMSERGAAMLAALCLAAVFAISLTSYLALCYTSLVLSTRYVMTSFRGGELAGPASSRRCMR